MSTFGFTPLTPHPRLAAYVAKMLVFGSTGRLPDQDNKLIVPNANLKLTLTLRNGMVARIAGKSFVQPEDEISLSGLIDSPAVLDTETDAPTGTLVIELTPHGAYRLFRLSYAEIKNGIVLLPEVLGKRAAELRSALSAAPDATAKLDLLQAFLIRQLAGSDPDPVYDHCIKMITDTKGAMSVAQLERTTGYSARWLHRKFMEHLGTGAKDLATIIRFRHMYGVYSSTAAAGGLNDELYEYYYDRSHFLRAFKRFTGHTPTGLLKTRNELATKHYSG
jgi:AraC-like DNA-binding protein